MALVGFPNAGKSTLISRISAARPKIADYPFTTLEPHLGVVRFGKLGEETEFVVADVPGLVEGAAEGKGLGHRFLRHVERARVLVILVDLAAADGRLPVEQERILLDELRRYRPQLLERPRLVVGSKSDVWANRRDASANQCDAPELRISSITGEGLPELLGQLARSVGEARAQEEALGGSIVIHRPTGEGLHVERDPDGAFVVQGRAAFARGGPL